MSNSGSLIWNADKLVDRPANRPARRSRGEAGKNATSEHPGPLDEGNFEDAPDGKPPRRVLLWGKRLAAAAIIAAATGIGSGLAGKAYEEAKAWFFAIFASHSWTAYVLEPNPICDAFTFAESEKAFNDVGLYEYLWKVIRVSDAWSGSSHKRANADHSYYLNGIDRGTYSVITYSSTHNYDGIGSYTLSHRAGTASGQDYYVGHWVGRECSIQGHPLIKCPMVLVPVTFQQSVAESLLPAGRCQLAEPPLPASK